MPSSFLALCPGDLFDSDDSHRSFNIVFVLIPRTYVHKLRFVQRARSRGFSVIRGDRIVSMNGSPRGYVAIWARRSEAAAAGYAM